MRRRKGKLGNIPPIRFPLLSLLPTFFERHTVLERSLYLLVFSSPIFWSVGECSTFALPLFPFPLCDDTPIFYMISFHPSSRFCLTRIFFLLFFEGRGWAVISCFLLHVSFLSLTLCMYKHCCWQRKPLAYPKYGKVGKSAISPVISPSWFLVLYSTM